MAITYRVYANDLRGGPVDYSAPAATVSGLSWDTPELPADADATFLVRSYDAGTGLEDQNSDARVRIRLDSAGRDLSRLPNAPAGLTATAKAGGAAVVHWLYLTAGQGSAPSGFHVYVGAGGTPDYSSPACTTPYVPGSPGRVWSAPLSGLSEGVEYAVAVRAFNASGEEPNAATTTVVGSAAGPAAPVSLAATIVP